MEPGWWPAWWQQLERCAEGSAEGTVSIRSVTGWLEQAAKLPDPDRGSAGVTAALLARAAASDDLRSLGAGVAVPRDVLSLGADVPVCLAGGAARMRGIGEDVTPVAGVPPLYAVLVNPGVSLATPAVFAGLTTRDNPAMPNPLPTWPDAAAFVSWLGPQRNDLQAPAIAAEPVIAEVLETLLDTPGCQLARMSGSGATCFGVYDGAERASAAAGRLAQDRPGWWVMAARLNAA